MGRFYDADESTVIYFDSHSGDTHLLTEFAAFILQQFGDSPLTTESLMDQISSTIDSPGEAELSRAIEGVLEEMVSLDILKRA